MTIQRHLFDGNNRVSVKELDALPVLRWIPPTIGKGGNLVHAEPREESVLRQAVAQVVPKAAGTATESSGSEPAGISAAEAARSFEQAREEGMLIGRQEGLQKGLEEGRRLGLEQGREQGLREGREQGQKDGFSAGLKQAEGDINQQMQTLNSVMKHLTHALNEQDYQLEQALLNLSREIARHVVQRELMVDSSHIVSIVRQALATLPASRDNVRILVNSEDQPLIEQAASDAGESWRVVGSKQIERGGCRVETDQSVVDFTTGERFKQVLEQIVKRQFSEDQQGAASVPEGESFQHAPDPLLKPLSSAELATAPASRKPSLAEQAEALSVSSGSTVHDGKERN